jgi:hypothetical protein
VYITQPPLLCGCAMYPSSPVDGVVVGIDSAGLGQVRSFQLRVANEGGTISLALGPLENATQFPPGHLAEHEATASPVRAYFRVSAGSLVVYRLEDAPVAPSPSGSSGSSSP